jgi:hypothetical protein
VTRPRNTPLPVKAAPDATWTVAYLRGKGNLIPDPAGDPQPGDAPVVAYVNHGRWVAQCECMSAQLVSPADPRFFCVECFNVAVDGRWRAVTFPAGSEVEEIEAVLELRPERKRQNWEPGETVERLVAENLEHGLPDPAELG